MIIKKLRIKNFRSYYDVNEFVLSDRLTLIIGDNGDGKSTLFEALHWLLNTSRLDNDNSIDHVSEMRLQELAVGEIDEVSVEMEFDHDGEKSIEKKFTFERQVDGNFAAGKLSYIGYETNGAERVQVAGKQLMDRCFEAFIQRFSMFQGESELNVFDSPTSLKMLVDKFSDVRTFDNLEALTKEFADKSYKQYTAEAAKDKKVAKQVNALTVDLNTANRELDQLRRECRDKEQSLETFENELAQLEKHQGTSERYNELKGRLDKQQKEYDRLMAMANRTNFDISLLDKLWVLCAYPPVYKEFGEKCASMSKEKRQQETQFDQERGRRIGQLEGEKSVIEKLVNGSAKLPWNLPDKATMQEMLDDEICKVCGRPAPKGSEAYEFMLHKLEEYQQKIEEKSKVDEERRRIEGDRLFRSSYVEELHNLSIRLSGEEERNVASKCKDILEEMRCVSIYREQLKITDDRMQKIREEISNLLIQAGNISEDLLEKNFADLKSLFVQQNKTQQQISDLKHRIKSQEARKDDITKELQALEPDSIKVRELKEVNTIFSIIAEAFSSAKKQNLRLFLNDMEDRANEYMHQLSVNDFHGVLHLRETTEGGAAIRLQSSNGTAIKNPSGSQLTIMYMSVLFAISDFTVQRRDENYPLIFDAATSSFGDAKEAVFYDVIDKLDKQCIIVTKDFITKGKVRTDDINRLTCSVYRIQKAAGFDQNNLSTIRTMVNKIK